MEGRDPFTHQRLLAAVVVVVVVVLCRVVHTARSKYPGILLQLIVYLGSLFPVPGRTTPRLPCTLTLSFKGKDDEEGEKAREPQLLLFSSKYARIGWPVTSPQTH